MRITTLGLILSITFLKPFTTLAIEDDSIRVLAPYTIIAENNNLTRMKEVEAAALFNGKKNDVVHLSALNANTATNNTRQIFSKVPGLTIWENDGSGIQVSVSTRGLSPNRSWELNNRQNGYDISSDIFGYPEAYYTPPMDAVGKIQLVRGGASLQFGSQFGGMINYVLKKANPINSFNVESQTTFGSYGLMNNYTSIGGSKNKWSYFVYHQRRAGNSWRKNSAYSAENTHANLAYQFNKNTSISAEYTYSTFVQQQAGGLTDKQFEDNHQQSFRARNWLSVPWNLMCLHLESKINEHWSTDVKLFGLIGNRNSIGYLATINFGDTINTATMSLNNRQLDQDEYKNIGAEWRNIFTYSIGKINNKLAFGVRISNATTQRKQKGKGDTGADFNTNLMTASYPTEYHFTTKNVAAFAEQQISINEHLHLSPGIRYEHIESSVDGRMNIVNNEDILVPAQKITRNLALMGIGFEYRFNTTNIYGNFSQAYRPVLFSELVPPSTTDIINPNLKDNSGYNMDLGYRGNLWNNIINFDISAFQIQYNNRIGTIRKFIDNDPSKSTYQYRTNLGKSNNTGLEVFVSIQPFKALKKQSNWGNLDVFTSLSLLHAAYQDFVVNTVSGTAPNVVITSTNVKGKKVEYAPEQIYTIGVNYEYKGFSSTIQTRNSSSVYTDALNTETANAAGTVGKINGYQVYDLSASYHFWEHYKIQAGINNLFNTKYATRRSGGYPGPGLLPGEGRTVYVSFGIKI